MDEPQKGSPKPVEESNEGQSLPMNIKPELDGSTSLNSDADSFVENPESDSSSTSEDLQVFDDNGGDQAQQEVSPFVDRGPLPPRAPVSSLAELDPSFLDQPRVLPSQPSIVRRMMDANKHYVDPKDARTLLPGVLFQSGSLDLDGAIEDGVIQQLKQTEEAKMKEKLENEVMMRYLQTKELERINENLFYGAQQQPDVLSTASNLDLLANAINEQCRVAMATNNLMTTPQLDATTTGNNLLQQMMPRGRHVRSISEPTFAFPDTFQTVSPFHQTLNPNAEALALLGLTPTPGGGGSFQQPGWPTPELPQQPTTPGLFTIDQASPTMADLLKQQQQQESIPQQGRNRKKTGSSRSVDFTTVKPTKRNGGGGVSNKDKLAASTVPPGTPSKNPTRAEVKKLVEKQTSMGRPTYAPWFRDKSGQPARTNAKDDLQIGGNLPSMNAPTTGVFPGHNRSVSTPGIAFNLDDVKISAPPAAPAVSPNQNSKSKGAGTGVFLPRLPT